jgi:hypothetical protein
MSSGYASRLSEYKDKGVCGLPEIFDSPRALTLKIKRLVELLNQASHVVVITGAGISTSAGIPVRSLCCHCVVLCCVVLDWIVLYCIGLDCIVLYRIALYWILTLVFVL